MAVPQGRSLKGSFECPHCQARYVVNHLPRTATRDSGSVYCEACRRRMCQWNAYEQPTFSMVERPPRQ